MKPNKLKDIDIIEKIVCDHIGLETSDLYSKRRFKEIILPRSLVYYFTYIPRIKFGQQYHIGSLVFDKQKRKEKIYESIRPIFNKDIIYTWQWDVTKESYWKESKREYYSLSDIGNRYNLDHATVHHGIKSIINQKDVNPHMDEICYELRQKINKALNEKFIKTIE